MVFWFWMLVNMPTSRKDANENIFWFLVIFFLHFTVEVVYFLDGCTPRPRAVGTV